MFSLLQKYFKSLGETEKGSQYILTRLCKSTDIVRRKFVLYVHIYVLIALLV
jgi:hypothetical protein